ncbi:MAG: hypothetical protein JNM00_14055, partial [Flavobacteriales bacterium]|nr:hypothetical protein [Flavobacteriales bacterium]
MKHILTICLATLLIGNLSLAQNNVGINTTTPDASALLDLNATDKGLLVPRMASAQRIAISLPATGLLVYDTDLNEFYFYDGTQWRAMLTAVSGWSTNGNAGTDMNTHFIGTTDNEGFSFRINNVHAGRIDHEKNQILFGQYAGNTSMSGSNLMFGDSCGTSTTTGAFNIMLGNKAGFSNTTGSGNVL